MFYCAEVTHPTIYSYLGSEAVINYSVKLRHFLRANSNSMLKACYSSSNIDDLQRFDNIAT